MAPESEHPDELPSDPGGDAGEQSHELGGDADESSADLTADLGLDASHSWAQGDTEFDSTYWPPISPEPTESFVRLDWVKRVLDTREADLRGHMVGLTYSKFALHLDALIHGPEAVQKCLAERRRVGMFDANWFNFATWGTVTVTRNIAHQRAPRLSDSILAGGLRRRLTPVVIRERAASGQRVSRALAWGQRLIFASVCVAMLEFDEHMGNRRDQKFKLSPATWKLIENATSTESVPSRVEDPRHRRPIQEAFELYRQASLANDPGVRARLVLGANVVLTAVEQDLADGAVEIVIGHVPQRALRRLDRRVARWAESWTGTPRQIVELQIPFRTAWARDVLDTGWSRLMTDQVLVMALPTETLRLGRDIPARAPAEPFYPWPVRHLDHYPEDPLEQSPINQGPTLIGAYSTSPETKKLLHTVGDVVRSFDRTRGGGRGSAAQDWRRFDDRMNWAVTLIRSRHDDETLFWPPYSVEDEVRITGGKLPERGGDPSELEVQAPLDARAFRNPQ